jgi:hypothetical protein
LQFFKGPRAERFTTSGADGKTVCQHSKPFRRSLTLVIH